MSILTVNIPAQYLTQAAGNFTINLGLGYGSTPNSGDVTAVAKRAYTRRAQPVSARMGRSSRSTAKKLPVQE